MWYKVYEMITFHIHSLAYLDFVGQPFKYAKMFEQQIPDIFGFSYSLQHQEKLLRIKSTSQQSPSCRTLYEGD